MSFDQVIPHRSAGYIEVIHDGHEDWLSAMQTVEELAANIDSHEIYRVLLDYTLIKLRIAAIEAPDMAQFVDAFIGHPMSLGIIAPADRSDRGVVEIYARSMQAFGHQVEFLDTEADLERWISAEQGRNLRTG